MAPSDTKRGRKKQESDAVITITFRHVDPTEAIRQHAERKLRHLVKFLKRPCEIHLILTVDKYRHSGEVTFKSGGHTVTAQEETKDLYSAIDLLADKAERQLKKLQEKTVSKRVRAHSTGEILSAEETEPKP
ncbi:MAG: ribosome-associated translation inhibitor RaiA [Candidatus Binataceae bacterium]|nr:ribosome-associated translation inhibitor RaiA [Candidatus Binataceae bacterium]